MYNKMQQILSKGEHILMKDKNDDYCVFSPFLGKDINYKTSYWCETREKAKQDIGKYDGHTQEKIEKYSKENNWQIAEIFKFTYKKHKVGDIVEVLDCEKYLKETNGWVVEIKKMIGKNCEVKRICIGNYQIYTLDKSNWWSIPDQFVVSAIEEETDVQKAIKLLKDKGVLVDGKVLDV